MNTQEKPVDVVCGLIVSPSMGERIFLGQRLPNRSDFPYCWECPGGKVEEGETLPEALRRELTEELEIENDFAVGVLPMWNSIMQTEGARFDRKRIMLYMFTVFVYGPVRSKGDHLGHGWFTLEEMNHLNLAPGNRAAMPDIIATMRLL